MGDFEQDLLNQKLKYIFKLIIIAALSFAFMSRTFYFSGVAEVPEESIVIHE